MESQNLSETEWEGIFQGPRISPPVKYWPYPWKDYPDVAPVSLVWIFPFTNGAKHGLVVWW